MALIDPFVNIPSTTRPLTFNPDAENFFNVQFPLKVSEISAAAIAMNLNAVNSTSTTSLIIGAGAKTLTVQTSKSYVAGMTIVAAVTASASTNYVRGIVDSYVSGTGVLNFTVAAGEFGGTGTFTAWTVSQTPVGGATTTFVNQQIQNQSATALTTTGTSTVFVATPAAAITANATSQRFNVTFHVAPTGTPTIAYSGQTALNLKMYDGGGALVVPTAAYVPAGWRTDVITVGTDAIIQNQFKPVPAFSAQSATTQSITTGVSTKVTLATENFDTNANFDPTLSRFTPTVAGYYQFNGVVRGNATNLTTVVTTLFKNGVGVRQGGSVNVAAITAAQTMVISEMVFMNGTTDYVELFGTINGTTPSFDFVSTSVCSAFSGFLVRAA